MEILVVAVVALIVFGPEKLPEMARKVGNFARDIRRMSEDIRSEYTGIMDDEDDDDPFFPEDESKTKASKADEDEHEERAKTQPTRRTGPANGSSEKAEPEGTRKASGDTQQETQSGSNGSGPQALPSAEAPASAAKEDD